MPSLLLTLVFSCVAVAGSLYLSLGLGLKACPLCFYQRTFAFALVGVLVVGLLAMGDHRRRVTLLALPLAVGGFGVAAFHTYLVMANKLECPLGIADLGPAPAQSLVAFTLVLLSVGWGVIQEVKANRWLGLAAVAGVALGGVAVYGSLVANPPPAKATKATEPGERLETCRVPYSE
jgi:disulfide bond formation protein DsbB